MILPTKHTNLSESLLGLSGYLLTFLKAQPCSIDARWERLEEDRANGSLLYRNHTFDNVVLAIDLLYLIGKVYIDTTGKIALT